MSVWGSTAGETPTVTSVNGVSPVEGNITLDAADIPVDKTAEVPESIKATLEDVDGGSANGS